MENVTSLQVEEAEMDFATLLEESFAMDFPSRGDVVVGTVLSIDNQGLIVDVGLKRDAVVFRQDLDYARDTLNSYEVGQEIQVMIINLEDMEGNLIVSVAQAKQVADWTNAEGLMENSEIWEGTISEANRGGLIVPFGNLRGFIPASHVMDLPRGLNENERQTYMNQLIGNTIAVKVIEVNRKRRRLVLSQREAQSERRARRKDILLKELQEGEVRQGVVSGLRDFGAFVDLGGADGLIHISELAWHRVRHPREILSVGDEIDVYILRLDREGKRIGLSLKRLQPNPWALVDDIFHIGQLVEGVVSRVTQFGAFVSLSPGIEALLHTSQMTDPPPTDPRLVVNERQALLLRVISIESHRQRLGLSLKEVAAEELADWQDRRAEEETVEEVEETEAETIEETEATAEVVTAEATAETTQEVEAVEEAVATVADSVAEPADETPQEPEAQVEEPVEAEAEENEQHEELAEEESELAEAAL